MTLDGIAMASRFDTPAHGGVARLVVDNLPLLQTLLGTASAPVLQAALEERVRAVLGDAQQDATIRFEAPCFEVGLDQPPGSDIVPALLDRLLVALASRPIDVGGTPVLAAISAAGGSDARARPKLAVQEAPAGPRTRADMAVAVTVFEAVAADRLYFLFQPIAGAADPSVTLYKECFSRIVGGSGDGDMQAPRGFMPALERLGLTRWFDRAVVERGLDFLRANPAARIGCNVSALSAVDDAWWTPVLAGLVTAPDVAERLVIEITETAPRGDIEPTLAFVRAFRRAGCRIAIDNFGAGFSGLRFAVAAAPDIIKIDACYVREQAADAFGATYLGHLVGLAGGLAREVVVVGIENDSELARARGAAAPWVQGRHVAPATLLRSSAPRPAAGAAAQETDV